MSYPVSRYQRESATLRHRQASVWGRSLEQYYNSNGAQGVLESDDFTKVVNNTTDASAQNGWFIQDGAAGNATNESFIQKAGYGGLATLSATTGTAHFGIELQRASAATSGGTVPLPTSAVAQGEVVFDCRITIDKSEVMFVGLTESIAEFLSATSTLPTDSDYIGFFKGAGGALTFVSANDNDGGTAVTDSVTILADADLVDGATYRLGFRVDKDNKVTIAVNDKPYIAAGASISSTSLPIELLTPRVTLTRGGGSDTTVSADIDYIDTYVGPGVNG